MHDYLPSEVIIWQYFENIFKTVLRNYCYREIRFPILERKSLFMHGIGNITDVIEKEMYSFLDKKNNERKKYNFKNKLIILIAHVPYIKKENKCISFIK